LYSNRLLVVRITFNSYFSINLYSNRARVLYFSYLRHTCFFKYSFLENQFFGGLISKSKERSIFGRFKRESNYSILNQSIDHEIFIMH
ncbi:hypothetical protein GIB67_022480, partial [Kingdonia uniflora]